MRLVGIPESRGTEPPEKHDEQQQGPADERTGSTWAGKHRSSHAYARLRTSPRVQNYTCPLSTNIYWGMPRSRPQRRLLGLLRGVVYVVVCLLLLSGLVFSSLATPWG